MKRRQFKRFFNRLHLLTFKQKAFVANTLKHLEPIDGMLAHLGVAQTCRHCHSESYYRWGYESGIQRYKCRSCGKTYNALTSTPLAKLRKKEKWYTNAEQMLNGTSIAKTSAACQVATSTAFRWRHRFLQLLSQGKPVVLSGIVETDEAYFRESHKGERGLIHPKKRGTKASKRGLSSEQVPVLVARDRSGQTLIFQLSKVNRHTVTAVLKPVISKDTVLCSDSKNIYPFVADQCGVLHKAVNIKAGIRCLEKVYHIQNVNAYDSRLKNWMRRFHGVATKYLQDYLGWQRWLDIHQTPTPIQFLKDAICKENTFQRVMLI